MPGSAPRRMKMYRKPRLAAWRRENSIQRIAVQGHSQSRLFAESTPSRTLYDRPAQSDGHILDTNPIASPSATRVDVILALYTAGYLALHFAATFQPWDRYLLPILPWICVLAARGLILGREGSGGRSGRQRILRAGALLVLVPALIYASWLGAAGRLPVGSDHSAYAGLDQAVALLRKQPADAVIYHRWLGWHYDFYLFDAPQERRWWGSGWKLADDAAHTARTEPARAQWVVLPDWENSAAEDLHLPLASKGLALVESERIYRPDGSRSFTMYRIAPLRSGATP